MGKKYFPLQVWATSIITAPIILFVTAQITHFTGNIRDPQEPLIHAIVGQLSVFIYIAIKATFLLLPVFIAISLTFDFFQKKNSTTVATKLGVSLVSTLFVIFESLVIFRADFVIISPIPIVYALAFAFTTFIYRAQPAN